MHTSWSHAALASLPRSRRASCSVHLSAAIGQLHFP